MFRRGTRSTYRKIESGITFELFVSDDDKLRYANDGTTSEIWSPRSTSLSIRREFNEHRWLDSRSWPNTEGGDVHQPPSGSSLASLRFVWILNSAKLNPRRSKRGLLSIMRPSNGCFDPSTYNFLRPNRSKTHRSFSGIVCWLFMYNDISRCDSNATSYGFRCNKRGR